MKLKKNYKITIAADGSAASGKTTGSKKIAKKFGFKFLSSGILYRYASYLLINKKPKNRIVFLKNAFKKLNLNRLNKIKLHTPEISEYTSVIAKENKIRNILKKFQKNFAKKYNKVCIEGRDIGTVILPNADIKFFFKCDLSTAAKRRFKELKKNNKNINLVNIKKSLKIRNNRDKTRKNSPLLASPDAIIVDTGKLNNVPDMINKMSKIVLKKVKEKYGSWSTNKKSI